MSSKVFIIACEASADHHGAELVKALRAKNPSLEFLGLGGEEMRLAGVKILDDLTKISALGFGDVIRKYPLYKKIFERTVSAIKTEKPDILVPIDSPAFNLRLAKRVSKLVPIYYYISPQLWAWGRRRVAVVKKHIKKMLVILPFEKDFYKDHDISASYVGHPLISQFENLPDKALLRNELSVKDEESLVGLFSGSREKEVKRILPVMLETAKRIKAAKPNARFIMTCASNVPFHTYEKILDESDLKILQSSFSFRETVRACDFALVASGTATLETALLETPYFLLYKTGWSTYVLGRLLVKVAYLGIVNLLLKRSVVPEFIQHHAKGEDIAKLALDYLDQPSQLEEMKKSFRELKTIFGSRDASVEAAKEILEAIS